MEKGDGVGESSRGELTNSKIAYPSLLATGISER